MIGTDIAGVDVEALRLQVQQWLRRSEDDQLASVYLEANIGWEIREEVWNQHVEVHQQYQRAVLHHQHALDNLAYFQSVRSQRDEQTNIGKFNRKLQKVISILKYIPEPHVRTIAAAADQVSSALDFVNKAWCLLDESVAALDLKKKETAMEDLKQLAALSNQEALVLDDDAKTKEEQVLREEWSHTFFLAKSFRISRSWSERDWQSFAAFLLRHKSEAEQVQLAAFMQQNDEQLHLFEQLIFEEWIARRDENISRLRDFQTSSKKDLKTLQSNYEREEDELQEIRKLLTQKKVLLVIAIKKQTSLKLRVEQFLDSIGDVDTIDTLHVEQQRTSFVANMHALHGITHQIDQWLQEKEELIKREVDQLLATMLVSQAYYRLQKQYKRIFHRLKKCAEADAEALNQYWGVEEGPVGQFSSWTLPSTSASMEDNTEKELAFGSDEPLKLLSNQEAKGRTAWFAVQQAVKSQLSSNHSHETKRIDNEFSSAFKLSRDISQKSHQRSSDVVHSVSEVSMVEELKKEVFRRFQMSLIAPSLNSEDEYLRWQHRETMDLNTRRVNGLSRILQPQQYGDEQSLAVESSNTDAMETSTMMSWMTSAWKKPVIASSSISRFTMATFNSLPSIAMARNVSSDASSILRTQLQNYLKQALETEEIWTSLVERADEERIGQGGKHFTDHEEMLLAWKEADRGVLREKFRMQQLREEQLYAHKLERSWDMTNRRVQVLAVIDGLYEELRKVEHDMIHEVNLEHRKLAHQASESIHQKVQNAKQAWQDMAEDYFHQSNEATRNKNDEMDQTLSKEKLNRSLDRLKASDEAVLNRWQQLQDKVVDVDSFHNMRNEYQYTIQLEVFLNEKEIECFHSCRTLEEGKLAYRRYVCAEAMRAAKENIAGASLAWESRLQQIDQQIKDWETKKSNASSEMLSTELRFIADLLPRLKHMEECEKKAQLLFLKEKKRLDGFELIWKRIQAHCCEQDLQLSKEAAIDFWQGNTAPWQSLTTEQRYRFNADIEKQNREYRDEMIRTENELEDIEIKLQEEHLQLTQRQRKILSIGKVTKSVVESLQQDVYLHLHKQECWKKDKIDFCNRVTMLEMANWNTLQLQQHLNELLQSSSRVLKKQWKTQGVDVVWQMRKDGIYRIGKYKEAHICLELKEKTIDDVDGYHHHSLHAQSNSSLVIEEEVEDQQIIAANESTNIADASMLFSCPAEMVLGLPFSSRIGGTLQLTANKLVFTCTTSEIGRSREISAGDILEIAVRRIDMHWTVVAVYTKQRIEYWWNLFETMVTKRFIQTFRNRVFHKHLRPFLGYSPNIVVNEYRGDKRKQITEKWRDGAMSNFEYLLYLNQIASRSVNDLHQYPIFPWVIADYTSTELDLNDPHTFRDFSIPIGAQSMKAIEALKVMREDIFRSSYCFSRTYSSKHSVLCFLQRLYPLELDGDIPSDSFYSMQEAWLRSTTDADHPAELIPEFFYQPEIFQKIPSLPNFQLPPWAKDPVDFISKNRAALESAFVRSHLHEWVDFVFGYRQLEANDLDINNRIENGLHYPVYCYEQQLTSKLSKSPEMLSRVLEEIQTCGQVPPQLFDKPHPKSVPNLNDMTFSIIAPSLLIEFDLSIWQREGFVEKPPKLISSNVWGLSKTPVVFLKSTDNDIIGELDTLVSIDAGGVLGRHVWSARSIDSLPIISLRLDQIAINQALDVSTPSLFFSFTENTKMLPIPKHHIPTFRGRHFEERKQTMYQKMLEETAFRVDSTWHTHKEKIQIYQQKLHPIMLVERDVEAHMRCLQYAVLMDLCVLVTCGHWDSSFALFSLKQTTNHLQSIKYHHDVVSCVCTAEDHLIDYWIVCGSRDCTISVWKLENDRCTVYSTPQHVLSGHVSAVTAVAASALLDVVVSGDASGMILVHHLRSGDFLMGLFSNGKILPELNPMPSPSVKDLSSNQSNHKRRVTWLGLSWKGFIVVYEASKYRLTTFSMTGRRLAQIIVLEKLNAFVFSKNGDVLITGGSGGLVVFRWVHNLSLADDGYRKHLAVIFDGKCDSYDIKKFSSPITSLELMRDEFVLMVGLEDGNLRNIFPDGDYMREHLYRKHQELGIL